MFWICNWFDSEGRHVLGENGKFILFKRKKDAKKYLDEKETNFEPNIVKISLKEAKQLFGKYSYKIIKGE